MLPSPSPFLPPATPFIFFHVQKWNIVLFYSIHFYQILRFILSHLENCNNWMKSGILIRRILHFHYYTANSLSPMIATQQFSTNAFEDVLLERINDKLVITLNRPKAMNALNLPMMEKIKTALKSSSNAHLVVIKSSESKAFCAGGDALSVTKSWKAADPKNRIYEQIFRTSYQVDYLVGTLAQPFIALIDGILMGGGSGVSINGQFRVATERTMFAMPETALGLFPDAGATHFFSRLRGQLGMFLALTGTRLNGPDFFHSGLATHFVDSNNLPRLFADLIDLPPEKCTKEGVNGLLQQFRPPKIAPFSLNSHLSLIDECFAGETVEEILKRLAENGANEFAQKQLEILQKMSPTSLKITFRQIRMGKHLSFAKVFPIEFRLSQRCVADNDLHEGCRAILIDKDRRPKWNPSKLEEISEAKIDAYFAPFEEPEKELKLNE